MEDGYYEFIVTHGITSEAKYPPSCNETCNTEGWLCYVAHIKGYEKVPANNEEALLKAVAHQPVSAAIDAGSATFQFYSSGVFAEDWDWVGPWCCSGWLWCNWWWHQILDSEEFMGHWMGWGRVHKDEERNWCQGRFMWHCHGCLLSHCLNILSCKMLILAYYYINKFVFLLIWLTSVCFRIFVCI